MRDNCGVTFHYIAGQQNNNSISLAHIYSNDFKIEDLLIFYQ